MLLDTCALLWLVSGGGRLTSSVLAKINASRDIYISAITGFEISLKYRQGKLELPLPPHEWFEIVLEHHGISVISLCLETCIEANNLPLIHKDPCDRLIIATAILNNFPVVTADPIFVDYGIHVV